MSIASDNEATSFDESAIIALYRHLLDAWNARDAATFAALYAEDGASIGFDGSEMSGRAEIAATLKTIFADHPTGRYVSKARSVTSLGADAAMLRAVAGIVPAGQSDLNPALNAAQTLIAARRDGEWRIVLYQNTPAQFHGRPEAVQQLTDELRQLL